ncbi:hypothetical protein ABT007_20115 [Streptomyces griseus]|uniref:hypothetical protein n=1 Tax=Streptomyces griseus TaxID=1911 RepID=UPI0033230CEA
MTDTSPTPADQLRAAAGHAPSPELARLLATLADASDHHPTGEGGVVATVVHPALAVARQLLGTTACPECGTSGACNGGPCPLPGTTSEETHVVTDDSDDPEHTDDCPGCPAVPPAPADRAATRDRIRRAICEASGFDWDPDTLEPDEYGEHADAVLAVLDPPADRAAVLREAADFVGNDDTCNCGGCDTCIPNKLADGLRRLAGEAAAGAHQTEQADTVLAAVIPEWEAVYEPGNVSDYLIGYANSEAAAKGAAIAWVLSQSDKAADRLEWVTQNWNDRHDEWFDLIERHDDGVDTGVGVTVRHRLHPYTAADFAPEDDETPAAPAAPEEQAR